MARAHSHAAPPSSISIPVDSENDLEFTRMLNRRGEYGTSRETRDRNSYGAQRLSATHAVLLSPRSNGVAGRTHCLRSGVGHLYADRPHFVDPKQCDRGNQGNKNAEVNRTLVHKTTFPILVETVPGHFYGKTSAWREGRSVQALQKISVQNAVAE
jgi:hypothetical protein